MKFDGDGINFRKDYSSFRSETRNAIVNGFMRNQEFYLEFQYWRSADVAWGNTWDETDIADGTAKHEIAWISAYDQDYTTEPDLSDSSNWVIKDGDVSRDSRSVNRAANIETGSYTDFYVRENPDFSV